MSQPEARAYCRALATTHYENFSVLTSLVPERLRDDFAAVYAFCRWSDDLGDETGADEAARQRSTRLLAWWRDELKRCFAGEAEHPVFIALRRTIEHHGVPMQPFEHLIDAFVQDQRVRRYQTWDQVLDYCTRSADPVGRIVLHLAGLPNEQKNAEAVRWSDLICSALQLTNFWQDVRRDLLERDRVYLPEAETGLNAEWLREHAETPNDSSARVRYIRALRPLVERTAGMFAEGAPLVQRRGRLPGEIRPVVWLFWAGGRSVLRGVEKIGCTTLWRRPTLTAAKKGGLLVRAWAGSRLARAGGKTEKPRA